LQEGSGVRRGRTPRSLLLAGLPCAAAWGRTGSGKRSRWGAGRPVPGRASRRPTGRVEQRL